MSLPPRLNFNHHLSFGGDDDDNNSMDESDDDLDIIEMTPRNSMRVHGTGYPVLNSFSRLQSSTSPSPDAISDSLDTSEQELQSVASRNQAITNTFLRDPSENQDHEVENNGQQNVLVTFISSISKLLNIHEDKVVASPGAKSNEVQNHAVHTSENGKSTKLERRTRIIGLREGERRELRDNLLFDNVSESEKEEFASFLIEDGSTPRIPVLCMSDFGIGQFASDLWVLPHNAIKRELFDLYDIISVLRSRHSLLNWGDFYDLRRWWRLFGFFWRQYCEIEARLLDPLISAVLEVDGRKEYLQRKVCCIRDEKEWICCKFEEIDGYIEEFELLPRGRVLALMCKSTDVLGFKLLAFFNQQERFYPALIESYHNESIKSITESKILDMLRNTPFYQESMVHLIRWMEKGKERDKWLVSRLHWGERSSLGRYYKQYDISRGKVVSAFRKKMKLQLLQA